MHSKGKITGTGVSTLLCRLEALVCARDCQDPEAVVSVCRAVMAAFLLFRCVIVTVTVVVVVVVDAMMTSQRMDAWRAGCCQALPGVVMVTLVTQTARVLTAAVVVVVVWRQPSAASSCCCWSTTSRSDRVRCSAPSRSPPPLINLTTTQRECKTSE